MVTERSVVEIWKEYASDAHAAVLEETWNGEPWKVSIKRITGESSCRQGVEDVWDMKTGKQVEFSEEELHTVLFPAGWSRLKTKEGNALCKHLRAVLAVGETWYPDADADTPARCHGRKDALASPLTELKKSLEAIGEYSSLDIALKQIECCQDRLSIEKTEEMSQSLLWLVVSKPDCKKVTVTLKIRLVLGRLKVLDARVNYPLWT